MLLAIALDELELLGPRSAEAHVALEHVHELRKLVERYREEHRFRLQARPGMTGPMQVFGRGDLDFDERLAVEREYIENLSLGRDLRILLMTLPTVLSGKGAF